MRTILIITFHWLLVQLLQEESLALPDLSPVPCKPRAVCFLPITESSEPPNVFSTKPPETITFSFTKLYYFPVFTDRCPRPTCPSPLRPLREMFSLSYSRHLLPVRTIQKLYTLIYIAYLKKQYRYINEKQSYEWLVLKWQVNLVFVSWGWLHCVNENLIFDYLVFSLSLP